jgi:hypothetical protein
VRTRYRFPGWPDTARTVTIGEGVYPSRTWAETQGLRVGSVHPCRRSEILNGTCTPVEFQLTDVDYASGLAPCR